MTVAAGRFNALGLFPPGPASQGQRVHVYAVGTTTPSSLYTDRINGTAAVNPVISDSDGSVNFFAVAGDYDLVWDEGDLLLRTTITVRPDPANTPGSTLVVPQTHEAAPSAATAAAVDTTASTSTTPFGYAEAQADAIVTNLNAVIVDAGTLRTELTTLIAALQTAGILASS